MLAVTAIATVYLRDLFAVVMLFGIYSLLSAGFFINLDAPDVALTEAAVGAGITTVLMLGTLALTGRTEKKSSHNVLLPLVVVTVTGMALIYGTLDMPHFADPNAPAQQHVAPRYIHDSPNEIGIDNMVASVLASYRGYDTFGEVIVIFTAGIGVLAILGFSAKQRNIKYQPPTMQHHMVLRVITQALIPLILLYGLYIQFHGDYGPGGGFQAGVIFAAAFILYAMIYSLNLAYRIISARLILILMSAGALLYGGVGVVTMLLGGNYLDYNFLSKDPLYGQHIGIILVEFGVGVCVAAVMISIFFDFTGRSARQTGKEE